MEIGKNNHGIETPKSLYIEMNQRINMDRQFEMLTAQEINAIKRKKINQVAEELYDVSNVSKISHLSEEETYIIRKLYGIFSFRKNASSNKLSLELIQELSDSDINEIKSHFFNSVTADLEKELDFENYKNKKKSFFELVGADLNLFRLNAEVFYLSSTGKPNFLRTSSVDDYLKNTPFSTIYQELKRVKICVRSVEDLKAMGLTEKEESSVILYFGLLDGKTHTFKEVGEVFGVCADSIRPRIINSLLKINRVSLLKENQEKADYLFKHGLTPVSKLDISDKLKRGLEDKGILTVEEFLLLAKEEQKIKGFDKTTIEYILDRIQKFEDLKVSPPIEVLGLPTINNNSLKRAGIYTIAQLLAISETDLRRIRNIGKKTIEEIIKKRASINFQESHLSENKELENNCEEIKEKLLVLKQMYELEKRKKELLALKEDLENGIEHGRKKIEGLESGGLSGQQKH